jgi:hypothetical protein
MAEGGERKKGGVGRRVPRRASEQSKRKTQWRKFRRWRRVRRFVRVVFGVVAKA